MLWAYQRVALGEVTVEKNRTLPDASGRERFILATMAVAILFMGIASPLFTRRMQASTDNILQLMNRPENAARPLAVPRAAHAAAIPAVPQAAALCHHFRYAGATVTMGPQLLNIHRLMPEAILSIFGIIVMIADPFVGATKKKALGWVAFIGAILALASVHLDGFNAGPRL